GRGSGRCRKPWRVLLCSAPPAHGGGREDRLGGPRGAVQDAPSLRAARTTRGSPTPMSITAQQFRSELGLIRAALTDQGQRVTEMAAECFDAVYRRDTQAARAIVERDDEVDRADVEIERRCVELLVRSANQACDAGAGPIRSLLTCVKVNNELERIADAATGVAER